MPFRDDKIGHLLGIVKDKALARTIHLMLGIWAAFCPAVISQVRRKLLSIGVSSALIVWNRVTSFHISYNVHPVFALSSSLPTKGETNACPLFRTTRCSVNRRRLLLNIRVFRF
jgi:hypothetical protein